MKYIVAVILMSLFLSACTPVVDGTVPSTNQTTPSTEQPVDVHSFSDDFSENLDAWEIVELDTSATAAWTDGHAKIDTSGTATNEYALMFPVKTAAYTGPGTSCTVELEILDNSTADFAEAHVGIVFNYLDSINFAFLRLHGNTGYEIGYVENGVTNLPMNTGYAFPAFPFTIKIEIAGKIAELYVVGTEEKIGNGYLIDMDFVGTDVGILTGIRSYSMDAANVSATASVDNFKLYH